ncbi:XYL1 [Symbiodinium natans]|uniref:XYL1 protein n=1 Tax=Symbiodinium natans TaxID=878477 RepID=A0A812PP91_9DINO|nr:XYL1 [Symbiodinium natans]
MPRINSRRRQAARAVDLFSSRSEEEDLGIIVGDFGAVSGPFGSDYPEQAEAPLQTLQDVGWSLAYDKDTIPASCLFGYLADFMATSRKVSPRSVEALATADIIGEAQLDAPLSDHKAIKVAFPLPSLAASRPLAAVGLQEMPVIGFGSHFMPEDVTERVSDQDYYRRVDELTQAALQEALAAGVRLIDSSNRHMNQQSVGRALEAALKQELLTRGDVFLCGRISKVKDREQVRGEVDMLLSELKVDCVDLLIADCPPEQVPAAWPWIEEVAREGRARFLGVSNFDLLGPKVCVEVFRKFLAGVKMPPAVLAMEVHPLNTNEEMSDLCQSMGIQVLAYSPLGAPHKVEAYLKVLTKSDAREMRPLLKVSELHLLQSIAKRYDVTPAQVALRWNLQRGHCVIPKSWNPNHILENTKLFHFRLTVEEMASISKLHKGVRAERFFQAAFSSASKALPQMTRDAHDECRKILNKIRGPGGRVIQPGSVPQGFGDPTPLPEGVARRGGDDGGLTGKVDWEKLGFHRPVEEEPGFWRRMGLATGKGLEGKGKGKGDSPALKDGLPVGGKGVLRPAMVGYR